jgi:large subunit ribosomal protein L6
MSRIAKSPITIPDGVEVSQSGEVLTVKGKLGEMTMNVHSLVTIKNTDNVLTFSTVNTINK